MHVPPKQKQHNQFNDYIITNQAPPYKLLSSQEKSISSNSIYYQQNSISRKKLTVISRDNSKPDLRGDYLLPQNISSLSSTNRTKIQSYTQSPLRNNQSIHTLSNRTSQAIQSLSNSRVQKSKLKRPISPSPAPMTPTKILKLKRSMVNQSNRQSTNNMSVQRNTANLSRKKFQSQATSPIKNITQSHRRYESSSNQIPPFGINSSENGSFVLIQSIKKELISLFNLKLSQYQSKLYNQQETIKILQLKIIQNQKKLKQKQKIISQISHNYNRQKSKTFTLNSINDNKISISLNHQSYIIKRIKDLQSIFHIFSNQANKMQKTQSSLQNKLQMIQSSMISYHYSQISSIKTALNHFLQRKSSLLSSLSQSISYLDNKLIGRTQTIKQTLCQLKQKVKQVQDSWTHKDTKQTKQSATFGNKDDVQDFVNPNKKLSIKRVQNKLKEITSNDDFKLAISNKIQGSLQFSITSHDQSTIKPKNIKNIYFDENLNQMSDVSIGLYENGVRQDMSRLTDDFYYPSTANNSSHSSPKNVSPISGKQVNEYYGLSKQTKQQKSASNNFRKKQKIHPSSPISGFKIQINQQSPPSSEQSQTVIKISNQAINKKIECIRELIQNKKVSSSEQIQRGQLRCYVDKIGYLKYSDSKTFVFDRKGNLIPCTDGQFWFLVTKGLVHGKRDDQQSRTMSFIQYDE